MRKLLSLILTGVSAFATSMSAQDVIRDTMDLDKAITDTPVAMIKGRAAGVSVCANDGNFNNITSTYIRGINTLRSDSEPIWIVDGTILSCDLMCNNGAFWQYDKAVFTPSVNRMSFLSLYDVESIEILKNTSQTARYGIYGANGVIVVNTGGTSEKDFAIEWNSNAGISIPTTSYEKTGIVHSHNIALSAVKNRNRYYVSANLHQKTGTIPRHENLSGGLKVNFDSKANKNVWYGLNSTISFGSNNSPATTAWYGKSSTALSLWGFDPDTPVQNWISGYDDQSTDFRTVNNAWLAINFLPQLTWETKLGVDFENNSRYIWYGNETEFGKKNNGGAAILSSTLFSYNVSSALKYTLYMGQHHRIYACAGVEATGRTNKFNNMSGTDLFSHEMRAKGLSIIESKANIHKFNRDYSHFAAYGNLTYDFKNIAGIDLYFRADNTSRYTDSRFDYYPGINAYVDFHKLLMPEAKAVSSLKLTGGWGIAGREHAVPYHMFTDFSNSGNILVDDAISFVYEGLNRLRSSEYNIGIDAGFLDERISFRVEWYEKLTDDSFTTFCFGEENHATHLWSFSERSFVASQSSTIRNRGVELGLDADILTFRNVKWRININGAVNSNRIINIANEDEAGRDLGEGLRANINIAGYSVGMFYGYDTDKLGNPVDHTGDGRITEVDKILLGKAQPDLTGALNSTLNLFGVILDAQINGVWGNNILNMSRMFQDSAEYVTSGYIEDGSYLRLSRLSAGYMFPMKNIRWIDSITLSLSGYNLATLTGYSGLDPDVNSFAGSAFSRSIDYGACPAARTIVLGVKVKF